MNFIKITASVCAGVMAVAPLNFNVSASESEMRDITTMELVHDMGIGINLGNTYESCGDWIAQWGDGTPESYETAWGSPVITREMIQGYADEGFGVIRIPVAWSNMMGDNYTISSEYLSAVREVVDWSLESGLYVILNIHYDNGWFSGFSTDKYECMKKYTRIWNQLTEAFGDYDDHLIFESLNEEGCWDDIWNRWSGESESKKQAFNLLNEINQEFVDIVRSSRKNNTERHLLIAGYGTDIELTCDKLFKMPDDPMNRCAVSVHYYTPSDFAILEEDADWGKARSTWGTDEDFSQLEKNMDMMKTTFIDNGIPVIVGEYGCPKNNKDEESVRLFLSSVCEEAYERQLCPVLWDITGLHYNRDTCQMYDSELKESLQNVLKNNKKNIRGDINDDGIFNIADAVIFCNYILAKGNLTEEQAKRADVNEDSKTDVFDLVVIRQMLIENIG
ncbi:MAG: cellulase family glycosylhydrolase [Ruminococcus sp.]|nr:cellulase family glycosylhydrolase [Ruminococcus sp.]